MELTLHVWRQRNAEDPGHMEILQVGGITPDMSFLEMLDKVNEGLVAENEETIAFDHDCREGICGTCSLVINGVPHGPESGTTTCQLHMRNFQDGDSIYIEPFRSRAFPVIKDLVIDRSAFDRIIQAGGFVSVNTGNAPEANSISIPKPDSDDAFDAAACIGCGACVASCPNGSAMLFVSAKIGHLALMPQGRIEHRERVRKMVARMDAEGFGPCSNHFECEAACPKEISAKFIGRMNRAFIRSEVCGCED